MGLPAVIGAILLAPAALYAAEQVIKFVDRELRSKEQKELMQKEDVYYSTSPTGEVVPTKTNYATEAIKYSQKKEEAFLESTPEIPVVSDVSKAVGFGKQTTGGVGSSLGVTRFLGPEFSVIGGGYFERQEENVAEYLEKNVGVEEAKKQAKILRGVGTIESALAPATLVGPEAAGFIVAKTAMPVSKQIIGKAIPKASEKIQTIGTGAISSFFGAFGESGGQTGVYAARQDATLKDVPNLAIQAASGGIIGGIVSAPVNVGVISGKVISPTRPKLGYGLEKVSDITGQLLDPVAETLGDITERKIIRGAFVPGIGPASTPVNTTTSTSTNKVFSNTITQTNVKANLQLPSLPSLERAKENVKVDNDIKNKDNRVGGPTSILKIQEFVGNQKEPIEERIDERVGERVRSNINILSNVQTRIIVPNKPNNTMTGLALPFIGLGSAQGRAQAKAYYNELTLLPRTISKQVNFSLAKNVLKKNVVLFKPVAKKNRGVRLGFTFFNQKRKR